MLNTAIVAPMPSATTATIGGIDSVPARHALGAPVARACSGWVEAARARTVYMHCTGVRLTALRSALAACAVALHGLEAVLSAYVRSLPARIGCVDLSPNIDPAVARQY